MSKLFAVFFQLRLTCQDEVAGDDLMPAGLVRLAVVMAAGVVDDELLLPLRYGVGLGDGGQLLQQTAA